MREVGLEGQAGRVLANGCRAQPVTQPPNLVVELGQQLAKEVTVGELAGERVLVCALRKLHVLVHPSNEEVRHRKRDAEQSTVPKSTKRLENQKKSP